MIQSYTEWRPIIPSDTQDLPKLTRAIYVGGTGDVAAVLQNGDMPGARSRRCRWGYHPDHGAAHQRDRDDGDEPDGAVPGLMRPAPAPPRPPKKPPRLRPRGRARVRGIEMPDDILKEMLERKAYSEAAWQEIRAAAETDMRFVGGDPWDDADRKLRANRPTIAPEEMGQHFNFYT